MTGIDRSLLTELVDFLQVFKDASDELEATKSVTIHKAVPWYHRLQEHCRINSSDSEPMTKIKTTATSFLESKFQIMHLHLVATALNPKMKGLKMLPDNDKQSVYCDLRSRVATISNVAGML